MSCAPLDTAVYSLTAHIGLVDMFRSDEERTNGLHVDELVARLPEGKKVNPQKLARCLRLLSAEHWYVFSGHRTASGWTMRTKPISRALSVGRWTEPKLDVFAPTRWALLNTTGSPTWAWHDPVANDDLVGCTAFVEHLTDPKTLNADTNDSSPFVTALTKGGRPQFKNYWEWINADPKRQEVFAHSMEGHGKAKTLTSILQLHLPPLHAGYINIAAIKIDYPWDSLPPHTTLVDVGAGQGSVALHVLRLLYTKQPTFRVVLQDLEGPLEVGKKYWAGLLPQAITDGRVEFEPHDFFTENPRKGLNTVYWLRFIMRE